MILDWIYNKLIQKLNKKKHDVLKLQWQKALLEQRLKEAKQQQS